MALPLATEQRNRLVRLLAGRDALVRPLKRQVMLYAVGLDAARNRVDFATDARTFANQLVTALQETGSDPATGEPAPLPRGLQSARRQSG